MKFRLPIFLLLVITLLGTLVGYYLINLFPCDVSLSCQLLTLRASALYYGFGALAICFFLLALVPNAIYTWSKFAILIIPSLAWYFIASTHDFSTGIMNMMPPTEDVLRFLAIGFVVFSAPIVFWTFIKEKLMKQSIQESSLLPRNPLLRFFWYVYIAYIIGSILWVLTD